MGVYFYIITGVLLVLLIVVDIITNKVKKNKHRENNKIQRSKDFQKYNVNEVSSDDADGDAKKSKKKDDNVGRDDVM